MAVGEESDFNNFYSICGLLGGIVFPLSTVPQVIKTYRTKSAKDLSYVWQALFVVGLSLIVTYSIAYRLWPILFPMLADGILLSLLIVMKIKYDGLRASAATETPGEEGEDEEKPEFVEVIETEKTDEKKDEMAAVKELQTMQNSSV